MISLSVAHWLFKVWLIVILLRKRRFVHWPSLLVYTVGGVVSDIAGWATFSHYAEYFYLFWSWTLLAAVLRIWILVDVVRSFPGAGFLGLSVPAMFGSFAASLAAGAAYASYQVTTIFAEDPSMWIVHSALLADRAVAIAWGTFLTATLVSVWVLRLGWSRAGAYVCNGLAISVFGKMIYSFLISLTQRPGRVAGDVIGGLCTIAGTAVWCFAMSSPEEVVELPLGTTFLSHRLSKTFMEKVG